MPNQFFNTKKKKRRMPRKSNSELFKMSLGVAGFALAAPIAVQALKNLNSSN